MRTSVFAIATTLLATTALGSHAAMATTNCESLPQVINSATVTLDVAQSVPAGNYTPAGSRPITGLPAFCRVHGFITPVPGSTIGFEAWLPQAGWNSKLEMFGNGGYSPALDYTNMGTALIAGYGTLGTDTGHTPNTNPDFALGHPQSIVDWSSRAVHESIVVSKQIANAFFGQNPLHNYFSGCSTGGQQAFAEVQRFPTDFDGVIAGDPGHNRTHLNAGFLWEYIKDHPYRDDAHPILPPAKLSLVTNAAVSACRSQNGSLNGGLSTDNYLDDPRDCSFDPAALLCPGGDQASCLTQPQVDVVRAIYNGPTNPRTGALIENGYTRGSETGWSSYFQDFNGINEPARTDFWKDWAFNSKNWDWWTFDFDKAMAYTDNQLAAPVNSMNADISPFRRSGAKLIQYHGFADPVVPSLESINYYNRVVAAEQSETQSSNYGTTLQQVGTFYRLFMIPGMNHCNGGPGPNVFAAPMQAALESWVERGQAPASITATKYVNNNPASGVQFSRPLCPYPAKARFVAGDVNSASSFSCVTDTQQHPTPVPAPEYLR